MTEAERLTAAIATVLLEYRTSGHYMAIAEALRRLQVVMEGVKESDIPW